MRVACLVFLGAMTLFSCGRFHSSKLKVQSSELKPCNAALGPFGGGTGSEFDPYLICHPDHWNQMRSVAGTEVWVKLRCEIDVNSIRSIPEWHGHLDGGFQMVKNHHGATPLFEVIQGTIKNVVLDSVNVEAVTDEIGALARRVESSGVVDGIIVTGSVMSTKNYVGGLVGQNFGLLRNIMFDGTVTGRSYVGGIAGSNYGLVYRVGVNGTVAGSLDDIGGIVGLQQGGRLALATGEAMTQGHKNVGGLVGHLIHSKLENSYSKSIVVGTSEIGGLIGKASDSNLFFCYASSDINASLGISGGLIAAVTGGSVTSSYWDLSKLGVSAAGVGRTPNELRELATYIDWEFSTIWFVGADAMPDLY